MSLLERIKAGEPINADEWFPLLIARKWKSNERPLTGIAKSMRLSVKTLEACLVAWESWW